MGVRRGHGDAELPVRGVAAQRSLHPEHLSAETLERFREGVSACRRSQDNSEKRLGEQSKLLLLEMPYFPKQLGTWAALNGCGPTNQVGAWPEEGEDLAISWWAGLEAAVHDPAAGASLLQRGRWSGDPVRVGPMLLRKMLAFRPVFLTAL